MIQNLNHLLDQQELAKLMREVDRNVTLLFRLGQSHFDFASGLEIEHWRQKISRLYYAAYNSRRAVTLKFNGSFSTDVSDHKNVDILPDELLNREMYAAKLRDLREDRNLADYNHQATLADLIISPVEATELCSGFLIDCKAFLV